MYIVYGIKNCDTVKKALTWLKENNIAFEFHDYKKLGISEAKLQEWLKQTSWQSLVNKQGTTYKKLSDEEKSSITDDVSAIKIMLEKNSIIKRPIIEQDKILAIGFDIAQYILTFK